MSDEATSSNAPSARCPECGTPLNPGSSGICVACVFGAASEEEFDPTRFGRYRLLRQLGEGGMGTVYLAQQQDFDRRVALKQLSAGIWATPSQLDRFKREAEMLSSLGHTKVLTVHEVGKVRGCAYYTMPFMEGGSLADAKWQDRLRKQPRELARLMVEIARTVQQVHDRQIIHRDLKPANILMDGAGVPHLADFGLAKELQGQGLAATTSGIIGTPAYMAPEQVDPEFGGLSTLTDVHALGTVLFELLTGRTPFGGREEEAQTLMQRVRLESPTFTGSELRSIDRDLRVICLKCLEKRPADRYPSAVHVAEDLERWLRHEPIIARRSAATERFVKWVRRRPAIAALTTALVTTVALGLIVSLALWSRAESARVALEERNRRLILQHAESRFEQGNSSMGLALLARALRDQPQFRQAQERLVNELILAPQFLPGSCNQAPIRPRPFAGPAFDSADEPQRYARQAVSPDGKWRVEIQAPGMEQMVITPVQDRNQERTVAPAPPRVLRAVAFLNATEFISVDDAGELSIWPVTGSQPFRTSNLQTPIHCLDLSPDFSAIALGCGDRQIRVFDSKSLRIDSLITLPPDVRGIQSVRFLRDGQYLMAAYELGTRGEVSLLRRNGELLWRRPFAVPVWDIQVGEANEDVHVLLESSGWLTLRRCSTASPSPIGSQGTAGGLEAQRGLGAEVEALRRETATSSEGHAIGRRRRNGIETILGTPAARFHMQRVLSTNLSADGRYLATASEDTTARIWDAHSQQPLGPALVHPTGVNAVRFSQDARRVVTTTITQQLRVWDRETGLPLTPSVAMGEEILGVALSRSGDAVLTEDGRALPIHAPRSETPNWLCDLAELLAGQRLSVTGTTSLLDLMELRPSSLSQSVRELAEPQWRRLKEMLP